MPGDSDSAASAELVHYSDDNPGISRRRCGRGFTYLAPDGARITDPAERARLAAIAVPPAYRDVWMAPFPQAHLWATGRDEAGRKQYLYNPAWTARRAETKFDRLARFAGHLPALRRWIARHLGGDASAHDTQVAAALALIDRAALRPGDPAYARENRTHGALTLEERHVRIDGHTVTLRFRGKGGTVVEARLHGAQLARTLDEAMDLPGRHLFGFVRGDGRTGALQTQHLTEVLREIAGEATTPKVLRTWHGTLAAFLVARASTGSPPRIADVAGAAAGRLGNTPAIAQASYVHPGVLATATDADALDRARKLPDDGPDELRQGEAALRAFLRR